MPDKDWSYASVKAYKNKNTMLIVVPVRIVNAQKIYDGAVLNIAISNTGVIEPKKKGLRFQPDKFKKINDAEKILENITTEKNEENKE